jgi:hypothetical protein
VKNGRALLPMVEPTEQSKTIAGALIGVSGRAQVEDHSGYQQGGPEGHPHPGKKSGEIVWHGRDEGADGLKERRSYQRDARGCAGRASPRRRGSSAGLRSDTVRGEVGQPDASDSGAPPARVALWDRAAQAGGENGCLTVVIFHSGFRLTL